MSANKDRPHVFVLPEDDENRQLANGFYLLLDQNIERRLRVLPVAGGWLKVLDNFVDDHAPGMKRYPRRYFVLLIDFDGKPERLEMAKSKIPAHLTDRVFVLGALREPKDLRHALNHSCEEIGQKLAKDCREKSEATWGHPLLRHNAGELARLQVQVRPILFPSI